MAILAKCEKCKREGGYAKTGGSKICARCERKADASAGNDRNNQNKNTGQQN